MGSLCHNYGMDSNETYEFENRRYVNPTLSSGEQDAFIDTFRNIQAQNSAQDTAQTQSLGADLPSNLGGLGGGTSYFTSRYQTPQVNEMVDTLKAAAQSQELQDVMNDYKAQLQNRYKQKQREYNKAQRAYSFRHSRNGGRSSGGTTSSNTSGWGGEIENEVTDDKEHYPVWQDARVSDNAATYGINYLKRNAGESDDAWFKRANEWAEKLAAKRNYLRTGKI